MSRNNSYSYKNYKNYYKYIHRIFPYVQYISYINYIRVSFSNINLHKNLQKLNLIFIIKIITKKIIKIIISIFILNINKKKYIKKNIIISYETKYLKDNYFFEIEQYFNDNNISYTKILIPYNTAFKLKVLNLSSNKSIIRLSTINNFWIEFKSIFTTIKFTFSLIVNKDLKTKDKIFLFNGFINEKTSSDFRIYYQIKNLVDKKEVKNIFLPFEGHIFERLICKNIKKNIFGFQIAPIFCGNLSVNNLQTHHLPNKLFPLSDYYKKKYEKIFLYHRFKIYSRGTSIKDKIYKSISFNAKKDINIILCPEGIYNEVYFFLNFASQKLIYNKKINFYLSLHPLIDIETINKFIKNNLNLNITIIKNNISFNPLNTFSLFSGSSSVIKFTSKGYIPLYLDRNFDELNPLFDFKKFIPTVSDNITLENSIQNFSKNFDKDKYIFQDKINEISDMIEPLNINLVKEELNIAN